MESPARPDGSGRPVVEPEQLELVRQARRKVRTSAPKTVEALAAVDPIARVVVDVALPHLDRVFDYAVPASMAAAAQPGCRVRVRFSGRLVDGYVVERAAASEHSGELARLARASSNEVVLAPEVLRLSRAVADQYAGVLADVLRLAVPPRHARTEASATPAAPPLPQPATGAAWDDYPAGAAFLAGISAARAPAAVWISSPGADWPDAIAAAIRTALAVGRGALVVVADARDVARVSAAVERECGPGQHVELTAEVGPAARYRRFLAVSRGAVQCVVGTRSAQFAPVRDLGLAVVWDDGDDLHVEPRAPYSHVREVLRQRARLEHAALLVGGHAMTAEARLMLDSGEAHEVAPTRATLRAKAPLRTSRGQRR